MAKGAMLHVRMDAELKEAVEKLYREMGTSFAEAVRIFAAQSVKENGMPLLVVADHKNAYDRLLRYAELIQEKSEQDTLVNQGNQNKK